MINQQQLTNEKLQQHIKLWEHQKEAANRALSARKGFAFFMEMGTGKTATIITTLRIHYKREQHAPTTLIICPFIVGQNWAKEFEEHAPELAPLVCNLTSYSSTSARIKAVTEQRDQKKIWIVNWEWTSLDGFRQLIDKLGMVHYMVCDESHRAKNPKSKRAPRLLSLAKDARKVYLASGSPILNGPLDIYMQAKLIGATDLTYPAFRNKYYYDANSSWRGSQSYYPKWTIKPGAEEKISQMIDAYCYRKTKAECLDLPPLTRQSIKVPLTKDQRKVYTEMVQDYVAEWETHRVTADLAITRTLRLQQLSNGIFNSVNDGPQRIPSAKYSALEDLLESILENKGAKVVVWSCWVDTFQPIQDVCDKLAVNSVMLTGQQSGNEKRMNLIAFKKDPATRVLIASQGAGGTGINLQDVCNYMVYFARSFNLEHEIQSEARCHRGGSEKWDKVSRYDLITTGTIEEDIDYVLQNKLMGAEQILQRVHKRIGL